MGLYKPGKNVVIGPKDKAFLPPYKRLLQADEFLYYLSFLFKEDMALPVKAAIAVVLKADQIRLYKASYEMFADEDVAFWVEYYKTLGTFSKQLADSEIYYFEKYLSTAKMPLESFYPRTMGAVINALAVNNKEIQDYQSVVLDENIKQFTKEFWTNKKLSLEEEKKTKELTKHLVNAEPGLAARKDKWIGLNFVGYLAGYFVRHPVSLMADSIKSAWEFKLREDVLKSFRTGLMSATDSLAYYVTALDVVAGSKTEEEFIKNLVDISRPLPAHPMVKVMYNV